MDRKLLENYFCKSEFSGMQADALSRILAEMKETFATKEDLSVLKAELQGEMAAVRSDLTELEARLTWRMLAIVSLVVGLFGTIFTLLNAFIV